MQIQRSKKTATQAVHAWKTNTKVGRRDYLLQATYQHACNGHKFRVALRAPTELRCMYTLHSLFVALLHAGIDIPHALGWLARQEPCVGQRCKDWRKQHPFAVLASNHQMYEHFGLYSPWLRALLVLNEWFGLLDMQTKGGAVKGELAPL